MDERELKKRINYVLLVFCTVIGWLFLPRQALSDQPIMLALANIIPLVLVAPFFLNFVAICLLDLLSERFVAINLLCGGLGYALAEVACAIDRVLELVPHNPYATDSDYHHVTAAECFQQLCCTLGSVAPAEKRYRKLIERFEAKGDHKFVLYRSLQHLAQVLEQLGQMDASEQISKRMMDTLSLMGSRDSAEGMGIPTLKCESLLTQGNICLKRGQLDEAVTHFQKALWVADTDSTTSEIDRKSFVSRALSSLYEACMLCGHIEQARRAAQQIIELCGERRDHTAADSYYRLSCACIAARDFERAEDELDVLEFQAAIPDATVEPGADVRVEKEAYPGHWIG